MAKQKFKITNWPLTTKREAAWCSYSMAESAISAWIEKTPPEQRWHLLHAIRYGITTGPDDETIMFRFKAFLGGHLSLYGYDTPVGKADAMVKARNLITL